MASSAWSWRATFAALSASLRSSRSSRSPKWLATAFPITANALLMGPLGYVTYFPVKMKFRVLDPVTFDVEPGQDRYSRSRVMDEAETIRATLQDALHDMLRERRSIWFG